MRLRRGVVGRLAAAVRYGVLRRVALRAAGGGRAQPRWVPRRVLDVVGTDVDAGAGVAAVRAVWRRGSARRSSEHTELVEHYGGRWRQAGGSTSSPAGGDLGLPVDVLELGGSCGVLSLSRAADPPRSIETARWVGCTTIRVGPAVTHVLVGARRYEVPARREVLAVWTSPDRTRGGTRPVVVALAADGTELSRIGPHDTLDTHTWARLTEEL